MFPLPPAWTHETGLPLEARIQELWDHSPSHQWDVHRLGSFLLTPPWARGTSISCRDTCPYHFMIRPDGPKHGSRSRTGLTSQDFRDLRACLHHHTLDQACRSVGYSGYFREFSVDAFPTKQSNRVLRIRHKDIIHQGPGTIGYW